MTYEEIFSKTKEIVMKSDVSGIDGHLAVQIDIKLVNGELDPVFAFTVGKLKIDGSIEKALEFQNIVDSIKKAEKKQKKTKSTKK